MKPLITTVLAVFTYCFVLGQAPMAVSLEQAQQYALEHAFAVKMPDWTPQRQNAK